MSLMNLVRSLAALVMGWTLVALGIGAMGGGSPAHPKWTSILVEPSRHDALPHDFPNSKRYDLIDQSSGDRTPLRLPEGDQWSIVSVSPLRDPSGDLVAVGRWVNRDDGPFCGLGMFRVSDSAVLSRVVTEILPTGRACWIPGQPLSLLFPAGDGRLHCCRLPTPGDESGAGPTTEDFVRARSTVPVTWQVKTPGLGEVFLAEPVWSAEPRLRRFVIVSLSLRPSPTPGSVFQPSRLWWLEMNDAADTILSAGPLSSPTTDDDRGAKRSERYPNVAYNPEGEIHLVYLSRRDDENAFRLHSARLGFEPGTGRPRVQSGHRGSRILGEGLEKTPLLVSADGSHVVALDRAGRIRTFALAGKTPESRAVETPR